MDGVRGWYHRGLSHRDDGRQEGWMACVHVLGAGFQKCPMEREKTGGVVDCMVFSQNERQWMDETGRLDGVGDVVCSRNAPTEGET